MLNSRLHIFQPLDRKNRSAMDEPGPAASRRNDVRQEKQRGHARYRRSKSRAVSNRIDEMVFVENARDRATTPVDAPCPLLHHPSLVSPRVRLDNSLLHSSFVITTRTCSCQRRLARKFAQRDGRNFCPSRRHPRTKKRRAGSARRWIKNRIR